MKQPNRPVIPVEEQFKVMADTAPVLIWISGIDKQCYFFNAGWLRFTGRTMEQEYGSGWTEGVHPDDLQRCLDIYISSFDVREEFKMEYRLKRHDGQYRWLVDNGVPRYTNDGTFAGYIGSCMDIDEIFESERVKKEYINAEALQTEKALNEELTATNEELASTNEELQQLQESLYALNRELEQRIDLRTKEVLAAQLDAERQRDRLKRFFMQAPAGICILDGPFLIFEMINPPYQQLFPDRELLGKPILEALPELKGQPIWEILQQVYRSGDTFEGKELLVPLSRTDNGPVEDCFFNFIYQARLDEKGNIDGILVFAIEVTDMVLAKRKIEESEGNLRSLVMTSRYALLILRGPQLIIEISNAEMDNIWGKPSAQTSGRPLLKVFPELDGQPFPALLKEVYETGTAHIQEEEELRINYHTGTVKKYVSFSYDPLLDNMGRVCGLIVSAEDITGKVLARQSLEQSYGEQRTVNKELSTSNEKLITVNEELAATNEELIKTQNHLKQTIGELAESESRFRFLVQQAPVAICILSGPELLIEAANNRMQQMLGKSADIVGKTFVTAVPELIEQPIFSLLHKVYNTGEVYYGNESKAVIIRNGQPSDGYFNFTYQPVKDEAGVTMAVMIVAAEVTEQVNARKKAERTEESLRMAIDAAELGSYSINTVNRIFVPSTRLKEFFGFGPDEEVPYEAAINQIHADYRQAVADLVEAAITQGVRFDIEYPVIGYHDGKIRWVRGMGTLQQDSNGIDSYFTGVLHEITEKKQDELRKNDFIGMVSHELKTPLTSLKGYVQLLNSRARKAEDLFTISALNKVEIHINKMSALINGFLNVARLESGKIIMNKEYFRLDELLKDIIEETAITASGHVIKMAPCESLIIYADQDKIGSVITNLLSNAVKYSPGDKTIEVNAEIMGNMVQISIKDEGIGISPNDIEKLFDRYYRVENKATQAISGFGIGLYLSAEIIARHEGRIWAESKGGKGSVFYFSLPLPEEVHEDR